MKNLILISISILIFISDANAGWQKEKESLEKVYLINEFRIFYSLKNKHNLPSKHKKDINKNNIPDFIDDIALQLVASSKLYTDILGFTHPLKSTRYKEIVKYIDVHILKCQTGGAGDAIINYNYKNTNVSRSKALSINLPNNLKYHSLTPAHEMFHLIQNGYTMFKNSWYTEGTARWSEKLFLKGNGKTYKLPRPYNSDDSINSIYGTKQLEKYILYKSYSVYRYWNRMGKLATHNELFEIKNIKNKYVDGDIIIKGNNKMGSEFIKKFFEKLEEYDKFASKSKGYSKYDWKESDQKSKQNNVYILKAIKNTLLNGEKKLIPPEILNFIKVIDEYIENSLK
jgi:hypothetical protein